MTTPLLGITCAALPADALGALASVRCLPHIRVVVRGQTAWVFWPIEASEVLRCLFPIPGILFYQEGSQGWKRHGSRLPTLDVPHDEGQSLASFLSPEPVPAIPGTPEPLEPLTLHLVRGGMPQRATALMVDPEEVRAWADEATTTALASVRAALVERSVLLLGVSLPPLTQGTRYWGQRILIPMGYQVQPLMSEKILKSLLALQEDEIALLGNISEPGTSTLALAPSPGPCAAQIIPEEVLQPLTRAGVRLAWGGARP